MAAARSRQTAITRRASTRSAPSPAPTSHALVEDGELARILLMEGFGPDAREKIRRLHERLVRYEEDTLSSGQQLGMASSLIGRVKEVFFQHLAGLRTKAELEQFPRELLATVLSGIGTDAVRLLVVSEAKSSRTRPRGFCAHSFSAGSSFV